MARKTSVEAAIEEALRAKGNVKVLRKKCDIKQNKLADDLGLSQQTVSRIERDKLKMSVDTLIRLSKYFEVTTDYLLGISDVRVQGAGIKESEDSDKSYALFQIYRGLSDRDKELLYRQAKNMRELDSQKRKL